MRTKTLPLITFLAAFSILITACQLPARNAVETDAGAVYTQAAQTAAALVTQPSATMQPTFIVVTPAFPTTTTAVLPTATSTLSPTATPTIAPSPTTSGTCTDKAKFVSDVTFPDNTEVLSGQEFVKTWRLENSGTCTWSTQYALLFVTGDQMNAVSPVPLTASVDPGQTVDLSVNLKAPGTVGTYRGDWKLQNASGVQFGTGSDASGAFFVQVKVVEGVSGLNLGEPTWRDEMDDARYWYLLETANTQFSDGDGVLEMVSFSPGGGEEWGLSNRPSMDDYYLQATFITESACSGLDRYGLLGRAPEENEGYVFEFSCDGRYRLYKWDGEIYTALQEWRTSASIKSGSAQTNVMGLWMQGDTIKLYANGYKLAEFTDSTYDAGQFGLVIGSINTDDFTVYVDRVEYWELNP